MLSCLVDGASIRTTSRITGVAKGTILRLLASAGTVCAAYQDQVLRNLACRRVQADEIWSFVLGKDRNIKPETRDHSGSQVGSVWTWRAMDSETKLMISWYVGSRRLQRPRVRSRSRLAPAAPHPAHDRRTAALHQRRGRVVRRGDRLRHADKTVRPER